ncbi:hydrolethalus syndrome protein 1 homolog isoform X2 [Rhipicephalus sanguineus]|uniref:hydrolethalus syndrome protein 1 homolog isoform X2 n=1 Tax=Rhipicephalus sanguineus TaxID=34632 RepID=UPI0018962B2E|nr:hydrolethalus syndrome protein 1 homolog isoform X2 [Rhipicephalus sanguineus]
MLGRVSGHKDRGCLKMDARTGSSNVVSFEDSVYLSDDEVRSELRKHGYGEVPYSVLQQFKRDFQRRIREEIRKQVNTSTPLLNGAQHASEQSRGSASSTKQARFESSSLFENVSYSSCYSSPYYESHRSDSCGRSEKDVAAAKLPPQPPRKVVSALRNNVKHEASSSCYSTPAASPSEQTTDSSKGSDRSGEEPAPRVLHRKVLRCCNGHAYISERSTLSTDSRDLAGSVLESFKENYSHLDGTLPKKPTTLPPLKGEPIQKDHIKPPKATMLSLLKVSGTKVTWNRGPHKCDPVTRYHEYKAFWERHKAPGEKAHKQLRWNVRAQMLRRDDVVACSWRPAITKEPPAAWPK